MGADEQKKLLFATVDLDRGEMVEEWLPDDSKVTVKLLEIKETRDSLREALTSRLPLLVSHSDHDRMQPSRVIAQLPIRARSSRRS